MGDTGQMTNLPPLLLMVQPISDRLTRILPIACRLQEQSTF